MQNILLENAGLLPNNIVAKMAKTNFLRKSWGG